MSHDWVRNKLWREKPQKNFFSDELLDLFKKRDRFKKLFILDQLLEYDLDEGEMDELYSLFSENIEHDEDADILIYILREEKLGINTTTTLNIMFILRQYRNLSETQLCRILPLLNLNESELKHFSFVYFAECITDILRNNEKSSLNPVFAYIQDQADNCWIKEIKEPNLGSVWHLTMYLRNIYSDYDPRVFVNSISLRSRLSSFFKDLLMGFNVDTYTPDDIIHCILITVVDYGGDKIEFFLSYVRKIFTVINGVGIGSEKFFKHYDKFLMNLKIELDVNDPLIRVCRKKCNYGTHAKHNHPIPLLKCWEMRRKNTQEYNEAHLVNSIVNIANCISKKEYNNALSGCSHLNRFSYSSTNYENVSKKYGIEKRSVYWLKMETFYHNEMYEMAIIEAYKFLMCCARIDWSENNIVQYWESNSICKMKIIDIIEDIEMKLFGGIPVDKTSIASIEEPKQSKKEEKKRFKLFNKRKVKSVKIENTFKSSFSVNQMYPTLEIEKFPIFRDRHFSRFHEHYPFFFDKSSKKLYIAHGNSQILLLRLVDHFKEVRSNVLYTYKDFFPKEKKKKRRRKGILSFFIRKPIVVVIFEDGNVMVYQKVYGKLQHVYNMHKSNGSGMKKTKMLDVVLRKNTCYIIFRMTNTISICGIVDISKNFEEIVNYWHDIDGFEIEHTVTSKNSLFVSVGSSILEYDYSSENIDDLSSFNPKMVFTVKNEDRSNVACFEDFCLSKEHLIAIEKNTGKMYVFSRSQTLQGNVISKLVSIHQSNSEQISLNHNIFSNFGRFLFLGCDDMYRYSNCGKYCVMIFDSMDDRCLKTLDIPTEIYDSSLKSIYNIGEKLIEGGKEFEIITVSTSFEFCKFKIVIKYEDWTPKKSVVEKRKRSNRDHKSRICGYCKENGKSMKVCGLCKSQSMDLYTYYCSVECQKKDWKDHKKTHSSRN